MFSIDKAKFFIPALYFFRTRISSPAKLISWIIIYIVPTAYISFHYFQEMANTHSIVDFVLMYLLQVGAIYNFYEVGYIENDTETIKGESNPTIRLKDKDFVFYEKNKFLIYIFRILFGCLLLWSLALFHMPIINYFLFVGAVIVILPIYLFYNRVRSRLTLLLHFLLVCIRFASYLLLYKGFNTIGLVDVIFILLAFPVINLLERAALKRFNFRQLSFILSSPFTLDKFRMYYYAIFSCIILIISSLNKEYFWLLILFVYYALYRSAIVLKQKVAKTA
ncbi:hypothetical protein SAMN05660461_3861 [Chitinophaga ginsengisegetis]|uniref:UbiA prenyltransferase family protein n=1 Tax=Chitinophaga ginsengisegetis TaxID=393003 RepID=A0A1T5P5S4_9BACT|nr:hypothetical protein SAMN05660461_3861 [Chitinophaga ginsengisegetis]